LGRFREEGNFLIAFGLRLALDWHTEVEEDHKGDQWDCHAPENYGDVFEVPFCAGFVRETKPGFVLAVVAGVSRFY
jgi:hypothetical protein